MRRKLFDCFNLRTRGKMTTLKISLLCLGLCAACLAADASVGAKTPADKSNSSISISSPADANKNITTKHNKLDSAFSLDSAMIQRALYVLIGITTIGVLYFLIRAVRLKKTGVQRKKYGLLSNYDDTMEMAHLESDEDDTTVYEAKSLRR